MSGIDLTQVITAFVVLISSLTVHEAAHAWSAERMGDPTARRLGRVSLNPAVHVDPVGTIVFPLMALTTGLPLIGWAKPVPVNVHNLGGRWRQKYMVIAAAGPASNLALALAAALALRVAVPLLGGGDDVGRSLGSWATVLLQMVRLNVLLAVFNLMPVPPLDGGNVLAGLVSGPAAEVLDRVRPYGFLVLYGLMLSGLLWTIVGPVERMLLGWLL